MTNGSLTFLLNINNSMEKKIKIKKSELRRLLFWAIDGIINSNGGSGENSIPKIIEKYSKEIGFSYRKWGILAPTKSQCAVDRKMQFKILVALHNVYPKQMDSKMMTDLMKSGNV